MELELTVVLGSEVKNTLNTERTLTDAYYYFLCNHVEKIAVNRTITYPQ